MDPYIKNNILHISITKGTDFELAFDSPDLDLTQYTTLRADFKAKAALDAPPLIRVELGAGITVTPPSEDGEGEPIPSTLALAVPYTLTADIRFQTLYMDIKGRIGEAAPVLLMKAECHILESTTEV